MNTNKIIRVLRKIDDTLSKNGFNQYQERIHRINKTVLSIERHTDCYVSNFTPEIQFKEEQSSILENNYTSNYLSLNDDKIEIENEDKSTTFFELNDLFAFIEDELSIKNLISVEEPTLNSSSSSENSEDDIKKIKNHKVEVGKEKMQKKFFNIELRLRAYLKEQQMFQADSILNESKIKTPMSKFSEKNILPGIIKNFFEDKDIIDKAKKRYSVRDNDLFNQVCKLGHVEEIIKCQSNFERHSIKNHNNEQNDKNITAFSIESDNLEAKEINNLKNNFINFNKRNSIFKDKFPLEKIDDNELMSEVSDEESISDFDDSH